MDDRFKFRYVFKHKDTGEIKLVIHDLQTIESTNPVLGLQMEGWRLISRDFSTGLKSKSGKLIFKGDIVEGRYRPKGTFGSYGHLTSEVTYSEGCFWVQNSEGWPHHLYELAPKNQTAQDEPVLDCKIIGDIYRNPELLNEQKKEQ